MGEPRIRFLRQGSSARSRVAVERFQKVLGQGKGNGLKRLKVDIKERVNGRG